MLISDQNLLKQIDKYLSKKVSDEIGDMSKLCYFPKINRIITELYGMVDLKANDIKKYTSETYSDPQWKLLHDHQTGLLIILTRSYLKLRMYKSALVCIQLLGIRYYTNVMHKLFPKYCDEDNFSMALERLSSKHLFRQKKTIGQAILFLSRQLLERYQKGILENDPEIVKKFIYTLRHRISQSCRSFAEKYYKISEEVPKKSDYSQDESLQRKIQQKSQDLAKEITVYNTFDDEAYKIASSNIKVNEDFVDPLISTLQDPKYTDQLTTVIKLLLNKVQEQEESVENIVDIALKLLKVKYTKEKLYFKGELTNLFKQIISNSNIKDNFEKMSHQTQINIRKFFTIYIASFVKLNL